MNPPPALLGSMGRDRKPFTYTPGGIDLSEIKSEKMAQRLMRNAMNQGVPEVRPQPVQSPPTPSTSITVPNFNCLPVQVFPSFSLPANPKSLLRTRSYPDHPKDPPPFNILQPLKCKTKYDNIKPSRDFTSRNMAQLQPSPNYGSSEATNVIVPEICYDAEYLQVVPRLSNDINKKLSMPIMISPDKEKVDNSVLNFKEVQYPQTEDETESFIKIDNLTPIEELTDAEDDQRGVRLVKKVKKEKKVEEKETKLASKQNGDANAETDLTVKVPSKKLGAKVETHVDVKRKVLANGKVEESKTTTTKTTIDGETEVSSKTETRILSEEEAEAVKKVAKEQEKKKKEQSVTNGDNTDTEIVIKMPTKKTGAKTETKVEIENKILSDGTVEETKTTTTTTTIDGKTEVKTKVDKRILSKEEAAAVIEIEEEEEEIEEEETENSHENKIINTKTDDSNTKDTLKNDLKSQTTTKKVVKEDEKELESEEEIEEETLVEEDQLVSKSGNAHKQNKIDIEEDDEDVEEKPIEKISKLSDDEEENEKISAENNEKEEQEIENITAQQIQVEEEEIHAQDEKEADEDEEQDEEDILEQEEKDSEQDAGEEQEEEKKKVTVEEEVEEEEEYEEAEEKPEKTDIVSKEIEEESECSEREYESEHEQEPTKPSSLEKKIEINVEKDDPEAQETKIVDSKDTQPKNTEQSKDEAPIPTKEPAVPLEKVEDVEIKPIGSGTITKTHTEKTEIVVTSDAPSGPLSSQTEFNRYENVVTVNRTTKTLDKSYEQMTQQGIPTVKTYFAPTRDKVSPTPQPARPYQPVYAPEPERRHSLLLERLSVERQVPTNDIYQNYHNLPQDQQRQWSQEPQSEVLTISNVKPSKISNQQWYQQTKTENVIYNNVTPTTPKPPPVWTKPQTPQPQPKPQPQFQAQPQFQEQSQFQAQSQHQQQPLYQQQPQFQPQPHTQLQSEPQPQYQYQPSYTENKIKDYSKSTTTFYQESYPSYTPTPVAAAPSNQYSFINKDSTDSFQTNTQQYSSNYVPPPWEQENTYATNNANQNYYQPPQTPATTFTPTPSWKPAQPSNKFSKLPSTSYTPPAPNQSFVKSVPSVDPPKLEGRKTYYSEYERRYITVPESNYVPGENKLQPLQPDPSPKYYYDNNETTEPVEHKWRKELREFTEKTSQSQYQTEQTIARPPWEENSKHGNVPTSQFSQTPTWSQTLRPRSWRERSFEAEYTGAQDYSKTLTNTLGRGRPVSSYTHNDSKAPFTERVRGVSVDRYNPNNYKSPLPAEHPPVQSHTLTPSNAPPPKGYHNPSVPAYHVRASVDSREQPVTYRQPRTWGESRASPIQSRSFKYLQWITGTDE